MKTQEILDVLTPFCEQVKYQPSKGPGYLVKADWNKLISLCEDLKKTSEEPQEPFLGLATTKELLDELSARAEFDGTLNYRTVDGGD